LLGSGILDMKRKAVRFQGPTDNRTCGSTIRIEYLKTFNPGFLAM
jgi:hypothetical protein